MGDTDPAIKAGRLEAEIYGPWMVDTDSIHRPPSTEGMQQYTMVLMNAGEKWNPNSPEFMEIVRNHHAYLKGEVDRGEVAVAGPFPLEEPGVLRGVTIFRLGSEETAKLMAEDPTVKGGLIKPELHPWATGTGVLAAGQPLT